MSKVLFWHRRDLRIHDNKGLIKALKSGFKVQPLFIFDEIILQKLPSNDQRVVFIYNEIVSLKKQYQELGCDIIVHYGDPKKILPSLLKTEYEALYTNRDYEPYAQERDFVILKELQLFSKPFIGTKDHVVFEKDEITKEDGKPYTVFTPYSKKWKAKLNQSEINIESGKDYFASLVQCNKNPIPTLESMGFSDKQTVPFPSKYVAINKIKNYKENRDFPFKDGTSKLSLHLRFGTISIRALLKVAIDSSEAFLNELIWRDFYQMIIYYFPESIDKSFKPKYDLIQWENNESHFQAWCEGKTGYPIVDAGMRELNKTGFMHNRVRMIVASFLTKHLLIDWRWGEAYFANKLLDFELASNVGGWQWASGSGCDAAPYFRVFNPTSQQEKFDKSFEYIKYWVPEFGTDEYISPIIEHSFARERVLERYKSALNS